MEFKLAGNATARRDATRQPPVGRYIGRVWRAVRFVKVALIVGPRRHIVAACWDTADRRTEVELDVVNIDLSSRIAVGLVGGKRSDVEVRGAREASGRNERERCFELHVTVDC